MTACACPRCGLRPVLGAVARAAHRHFRPMVQPVRSRGCEGFERDRAVIVPGWGAVA